MAHRDFDTEAAAEEQGSTFVLAGRTWHLRPQGGIPLGVVRRLYKTATSDADGDQFVQLDPFFRGVIVASERDTFLAMLDDEDSALTLATLQPLVEWIVEQVMERPTAPPSVSSAGSRPTGRSSKARSSSPATTQVASA